MPSPHSARVFGPLRKASRRISGAADISVRTAGETMLHLLDWKLPNLQGKILIITGSTGIGAAATLLAAAEGARVVIATGDPESGWELARHTGCEVWVGDLTRPDSARSVLAQCVSNFGRVDALFNVAGLSGRRPGSHAREPAERRSPGIAGIDSREAAPCRRHDRRRRRRAFRDLPAQRRRAVHHRRGAGGGCRVES
jgi:NAD(P)-dependent dehydrogenase (short-subunit alcohol dehydrogenase family)